MRLASSGVQWEPGLLMVHVGVHRFVNDGTFAGDAGGGHYADRY